MNELQNTPLAGAAPAETLLQITNGRVMADSLGIAQHFEKQHKDVLKSIRNLECSEEFSLRNFAESTYRTERGKEYPMVQMTRDGFCFLAMGFTGAKAAEWKEKYIAAFNAMEAQLLQVQQLPGMNQLQGQLIDAQSQLICSQKMHLESLRRAKAEATERERLRRKACTPLSSLELQKIIGLKKAGVFTKDIAEHLERSKRTVARVWKEYRRKYSCFEPLGGWPTSYRSLDAFLDSPDDEDEAWPPAVVAPPAVMPEVDAAQTGGQAEANAEENEETEVDE